MKEIFVVKRVSHNEGTKYYHVEEHTVVTWVERNVQASPLHSYNAAMFVINEHSKEEELYQIEKYMVRMR